MQVSDVHVLTVRCKLLNFVRQIFSPVIAKMSAGFASYIVQIISIISSIFEPEKNAECGSVGRYQRPEPINRRTTSMLGLFNDPQDTGRELQW
jgi:hypothetical protein